MIRILTIAGLLISALTASAQPPSLDAQYEKATFEAVSKVAPCVVLIETSGGQDVMLATAVRKVVGPTTGLAVDPDGYIITSSFNFTNRPTDIFVTVPGKGKAVAKVVAHDLSRMLTLLKIDLKDLAVPTAFPKAEVEVGQTSLALGRTLEPNVNKMPSIASGIISAKNRIWGKAVQTDAKVSPNNYGGPLVALDGRVYGVLVPASSEGEETDTAGTEWYDSGIGFAIPLEDVMKVLPKLKAGTAEKPVNLRGGILGIPAPQPPQYLDAPTLTAISPKSAAEAAGLKAGDKVLSVDGKTINTLAQFLHTIKPLYEGDSISIKVKRGDQEIDIPKIVLRGVQTDLAEGFLGILPMRDDPELGVEIRLVFPDSPADKAGLKAGDRLMKLAPEGIKDLLPFAGRDSLLTIMSRFVAGTSLQFEVKKKDSGKTEKITVKLAEMNDSLPEKFPQESSKKRALERPKPIPKSAMFGPGNPFRPGDPAPGETPLKPKEKDPAKPKDSDKKPQANSSAGNNPHQDDKKPGDDKKPEEKKKYETGLIQKSNPEQGHDYWVYVPENYDPNISHGLIVWLHPAGVDGKDAKEITNIWKLVCEEFNFIMIGPITHNKDGWIPSETDYIVQDIQNTINSYTIDRARIATHGSGVGGQMAFYVAFRERSLIRGVAAVGAVLGTQPKDKIPSQRLSFFIAAGQKDPLLKDIKESRLKLEKKKFPVIWREMAEIGKQYIFEDDKAIRDLVRWFDSLDRL